MQEMYFVFNRKKVHGIVMVLVARIILGLSTVDRQEWDDETQVGYYQKFVRFTLKFLLEVLSAIFPKSNVLFDTSQENIKM